MYLGAYHFTGSPDDLLPAYDRLMTGFPPDAIDLHLCVVTATGITVLDACPSQEDFEGFSSGPEFAGALRAAGLPAPRVEGLGDVASARLRQPVAR